MTLFFPDDYIVDFPYKSDLLISAKSDSVTSFSLPKMVDSDYNYEKSGLLNGFSSLLRS